MDNLEALPSAPGVYIFRGEGRLPLYIGKSVDLRARVRAHLRAPDEARMMAQTRRVDFIETAGEIGALLLEARLIKSEQPLFNIRLRRQRQLHTLRLQALGAGLAPVLVSSREVALGRTEGLYGVFGSAHAAKDKLRELAHTHRLCLALLGLEKAGARGCFGVQLGRCDGACVGREARGAHDARLKQALADWQVRVWPHAGAVDLVEARGDWTQRHRIDHWHHLATWCSRSGTTTLHAPSDFDLDSYKILVKPILLGQGVAPVAAAQPAWMPGA